MGINKRGILYTIVAVALSIVVLLTYKFYKDTLSANRLLSANIRIGSIDHFVGNLEKDVENAIYIVGFRSLISIEDFLIEKNPPETVPKFLNELGTNFNKSFDEVFRVGTINTQVMANMTGNTFQDWINKMETEADKRDIELDITIPPNGIEIQQIGAFTLEISINLSIDAKDKNDLASWKINRIYSKRMGIEKFYDPLYLVKTNGLIKNEIKSTNVNFSFSTENLNTHLINSWYTEHNDSPNYLNRFENNLNASIFGIESLVNSQNLIDNGITPLTRSAVDFIYFGDIETENCRVQGFGYNLFFLDTEPYNHLEFYGATCEEEETECPLNPSDYDRIFLINKWLRADLNYGNATSGKIEVVIPAGKHDVTLVSYDKHSETIDEDLNERWYLEMYDVPPHLEITSSPISDLPVEQDFLTEQVDDELHIKNAIHTINAVHAEYPSVEGNKVKAVCAGFKKKED